MGGERSEDIAGEGVDVFRRVFGGNRNSKAGRAVGNRGRADRVHELVAEVRPAAIVHLAAIAVPREVARDPEEAERVNCGAVDHLLEAVLRSTPDARLLFISPRTVNFHLDNIYSKLGVSSRTEAAIYALRQGWTRAA